MFDRGSLQWVIAQCTAVMVIMKVGIHGPSRDLVIVTGQIGSRIPVKGACLTEDTFHRNGTLDGVKVGLEEIFHENKVDLCLSGHEHSYGKCPRTMCPPNANEQY